MCGIWGLVAKHSNGFYKDHVGLAEDMLLCGQLRGMHGTGMFMVNKDGQPEYLKIGGNAQKLMDDKEFNPYMNKVLQTGVAIVGHNRFATRGDHTTPNAHPFYYKNITLVHNGLVSSTDMEKNKVKVDSHSFTKDLSAAGDNYKELLQETNGAFTFVWHNKKLNKLLIYRNHERPMNMFEGDSTYMFASEGNMVRWLAGRRNLKHDYIEIKPEVLYSFDLDAKYSRKMEEERLPKKHEYYPGFTPPASSPWNAGPVNTTRKGHWKNNIWVPDDAQLALVPKLPVVSLPAKKSMPHEKKVGDSVLFSLYDEVERGLGSTKVYEYQGILEADAQSENVEVVFMSKNKQSDWLDKPLLCGDICAIYPDGTIQIKTKTVCEVDTGEIETTIEQPVQEQAKDEDAIIKLKDGTTMSWFKYHKLAAMRCLGCHDKVTDEEATMVSFSEKIHGLYCPDCTLDIEHNTMMYPMYHQTQH
jgi:predicted glutamine amidotransferase